MIVGADYRVFVIEDRVVAVARRWPASVTGDGVHSVAELVDLKSKERRKLPYIRNIGFKLTPAMHIHLAQQGLSSNTVPERGARVQLLAIANISVGGDSEDVTESVHASFAEIAVRARRAVPGLFHAGVDILATDISAPADQQA